MSRGSPKKQKKTVTTTKFSENNEGFQARFRVWMHLTEHRTQRQGRIMITFRVQILFSINQCIRQSEWLRTLLLLQPGVTDHLVLTLPVGMEHELGYATGCNLNCCCHSLNQTISVERQSSSIHRGTTLLKPFLKQPEVYQVCNYPDRPKDGHASAQLMHELNIPRSYKLSGVIIGPQFNCGGYGSIFRGQWNGHDVVIKEIQNRESWKIEVDILSQCRHSSIVKFYGAFTNSAGALCIVLEYCSLGSLNDWIFKKGNRLPEPNIINIALSIASGEHSSLRIVLIIR